MAGFLAWQHPVFRRGLRDMPVGLEA